MDFHDGLYLTVLLRNLIQFWLKSCKKERTHYTKTQMRSLRVSRSVSSVDDSTLGVGRWSEAMAIPFINFTDEISERARIVALFVHFLSCLMFVDDQLFR
jgi:hypothetical protein